MFPVKMTAVFRNRWMALLWAAGIIWFAYDFAGSAPVPDSNSANAEEAAGATGDAATQNKIPATWN